MVSAGIIEKKCRELTLEQCSFASSLHVAAQLPQFIFPGLTEAFAAVAVMELLTAQMPENMRSIAGTMFFLSLSIASYLNSLIVNIIHSVTRENEKFPWLGGHDLNENQLEYYNSYCCIRLYQVDILHFLCQLLCV